MDSGRIGDPLRLQRDLVCLDTETTGADPSVDRVVQIALVRLHPNGAAEEFESLVNPGMPIPEEAVAVHGITNDMVEFAPPFRRLAADLARWMENADLAGFNLLRFDLPLLRLEFQRAGQPWDISQARVLDAQVIFHKMEPRNLGAAYRFYCGHPLEGAHGALADARAALAVLRAQIVRYPELPNDVAALAELFPSVDPRFLDPERRFTWRNGEVTFNFGTRRGRTLRSVAEADPEYLEWMLERDFSPEVRKLIEDAKKGCYPSRS